MKLKTALTIAGSDSSGGAGIQADIKTMTMNGVYAMSAVTALTAQNTLGVKSVMEASPEFLSDELDAVFTDIFPDAVKTGMVSSCSLICVIADKLRQYGALNIVVDPVMVSAAGARLISDDAIGTLKAELLPLATVITPNIPEAEVLAEMRIRSEREMEEAAGKIFKNFERAVLVKGGHDLNDASDLFWDASGAHWFRAQKVENPNTHGTGCTLSSAIASRLALGETLPDAVRCAKDFVSGALSANLDLGHGKGPVHHMFALSSGHFSKFCT